MAKSVDEYLIVWEHFKINAEQRMKAFYYFLVISIFIDGGIFASIHNHTSVELLKLQGIFVSVLSIIFFLADVRSQRLLKLSIEPMKNIEKDFSVESAKLFTRDENQRGFIFRYGTAITLLLAIQFVFGLYIIFFYN